MERLTAQDTFDHILGAGALGYAWYLILEFPEDPAETGADAWKLRFAELDDHGETGHEFTVTHRDIVRAIRTIAGLDRKVSGEIRHLTSVCRRECRNLIFDRDETDFDSATADEVIQYAAFGEIRYG